MDPDPAVAVAAALAATPGCGEDAATVAVGSPPPAAAPETIEPSSCPDLAGCRSGPGADRYVEAVDPDGDGDAHFVIAQPQGITLPGLTAIDVRRGLRRARCRGRVT